MDFYTSPFLKALQINLLYFKKSRCSNFQKCRSAKSTRGFSHGLEFSLIKGLSTTPLLMFLWLQRSLASSSSFFVFLWQQNSFRRMTDLLGHGYIIMAADKRKMDRLIPADARPNSSVCVQCSKWTVQSYIVHTYMPSFNLRVWVKVQILNRFLAFMLYAVHLRNSEVY